MFSDPMNQKNLPSLLTMKVDPPDQNQENNSEVVLPQALEDVLALKNQRALELGTEDSIAEENSRKTVIQEGESLPTWEKDDNVVTLHIHTVITFIKFQNTFS